MHPNHGGGAWATVSPAGRLHPTGHARDTHQACSDRDQLTGSQG